MFQTHARTATRSTRLPVGSLESPDKGELLLKALWFHELAS